MHHLSLDTTVWFGDADNNEFTLLNSRSCSASLYHL